MALVLITGGSTRGLFEAPDTPLTTYVFDAVVSFKPLLNADVTRHPVEGGSTISDHVLLNNTTIQFEGVVSGYPLLEPVVPPGAIDAISNNPIGPIPIDAQGRKRILSAHQVLTAAFKAREPITVASEFENYRDCIITSLSFPQTAQTGSSLRIVATLEQIQIVKSKRATVSDELLDAAAIKLKKGDKSVKDSSNATGADKALFSRTVDAILNTLPKDDQEALAKSFGIEL